jgi:hypothetical protein
VATAPSLLPGAPLPHDHRRPRPLLHRRHAQGDGQGLPPLDLWLRPGRPAEADRRWTLLAS